MVAWSSTGLKPRTSAAARSWSRSWPPAANKVRAMSSLIQPCSALPPPARWNCSCEKLFTGTLHGYDADGVVWISRMPAAPWRTASSNLYAQRPYHVSDLPPKRSGSALVGCGSLTIATISFPFTSVPRKSFQCSSGASMP